MKPRQFAAFVAPSVLMMLALMALPLVMTVWLSLRSCNPVMEQVRVQQSGPFGSQEVLTQQAKLGANGKPLEHCAWVGGAYYRKVLGLDATADRPDQRPDQRPDERPNERTNERPDRDAPANEFWVALRFTLVYVAATTPFILLIGLGLALGVNRLTQRLKSLFITAALLPFILTPLVGALAIKWLFRDDGLVSALLAGAGLHIHWMAQASTAQLLIVLYGIWHVAPFAFIVLYAGLQSVSKDALEAARIDGATRWQLLRFVTLPHLMPLVVFIMLIHLMDAYRVFEPVLVLTQGAFTTSVQYLTYHILLNEANPYKASAAAVLTLAGIAVLLVPLLVKTWREQRAGQ